MNVLAKFRGDGAQALAMRGVIWTAAGFGLTNLLRLISNLILTRLLAPEIFGLMALANIVLAALILLSDVGTTASVVRSDRGQDKTFLNTVWTVQVIRGFAIGLIACLLAWPAAQIYDEPLLFPIICLISLAPIAQGFQSVMMATFNREMSLFRLTLMNLTAQALSVGLTIGLALILENVWAMAIGAAASGLFVAALSHIMLSRFQHRFHLEREAVTEVIAFGRWILLGTLFTFFGNRGGQMIQGLLVPLDVLGLIAIAALIGRLPSDLIRKLFNIVFYPMFAKLRREAPDELAKTIFNLRLIIVLVVLPFMFTVALFAQPLVDLMYDARYAAVGYALALILCEDVIWLLTAPYQKLLLSDGKSKLHAMIMLVWAAARTMGMVVGFQIAGIPGMFAGMAVGTALMFLVSVAIARREGYATVWLDLAYLAVTGAFFVYILTTTELPAALQIPS